MYNKKSVSFPYHGEEVIKNAQAIKRRKLFVLYCRDKMGKHFRRVLYPEECRRDVLILKL